MELAPYDLIVINSNGGKDSLCSVYEICRMADLQGYNKNKIVVSHQDLGESEWKGTRDLVAKQSKFFGLATFYSKRRDKNGKKETLLEYAERRGKWPSSSQRWCTSDFKRGPGAREITQLGQMVQERNESGEAMILHVFGFRKEESTARSKKKKFILNKKLTTKKRLVFDYLPIHHWSSKQVWEVIKKNILPYHFAYDLGMPRLSCVFCIFSPFNALVIAGLANPDLLNKYVEVEEKIGHAFKYEKKKPAPIADVKKAISEGYKPTVIEDWTM